jgi:hypothetical protein
MKHVAIIRDRSDADSQGDRPTMCPIDKNLLERMPCYPVLFPLNAEIGDPPEPLFAAPLTGPLAFPRNHMNPWGHWRLNGEAQRSSWNSAF